MIKFDYCSITVVNHDGTWLIRLVSKSYTHLWKNFTNEIRLVLHPWKKFTNKIRLVLHACIRFFWKKIHGVNQTRPMLLCTCLFGLFCSSATCLSDELWDVELAVAQLSGLHLSFGLFQNVPVCMQKTVWSYLDIPDQFSTTCIPLEQNGKCYKKWKK